MRLLLDTGVFLWLGWDDPKLSGTIRSAFEDPATDVFLSSVSAWEIAVKHALGKLPLPAPSAEAFVTKLREASAITSLPLDEASTFTLAKLPPLHRDPFDRMLIAQAITQGLVLATADEAIVRYPVRTLT